MIADHRDAGGADPSGLASPSLADLDAVGVRVADRRAVEPRAFAIVGR
jgi:hypothetical protein